MIKWFKAQSTTVKGMIILIIIAIAGIILRWNFISKEVGEAVGSRISNTIHK